MAGKYTAYPEYKDSGVEWLGEIPMNWEALPCRAVVSNISNKNEGAKDQNYLSLMANIGVVRYEDKGAIGNKKPEDLSKCKIVKKGNLVINSMNYAIGSYGMSSYDGVCRPVYIVLKTIRAKLQERLVLRIFENKPFQKYLATFGNGILEHRAAIGWDDIKGAYIAIPPRKDQCNILNFLDHETAKIDALIEKQQQLIKLLKEKCQAIISHAVTKGLNPNAPMRDSGVEWLGEVPEHWEIPKVTHIGKVLNGSTPDKSNLSYWTNGSISWLASSCLNTTFVTEASQLITVEAYNNSSVEIVPSDSLLVGMVGQGKTRGSSAVLSINSCINQNMAAIIPKDKIKVIYLYYLFQSMYEDLRELGRGGNQAALNCEIIGSIKIPLPPIHEQSAIISSLSGILDKLKRTDIFALQQIALLKERRTALISAAVTGKIDLRNWQVSKLHLQENQ